jgi:hypothetical protein
MVEHNYVKELGNIVAQMLSQAPHEEFKKYWELYKETAYIPDPKGIYFRISQDATYRNVVLAGENGVVDIEVDENSVDDRDIYVTPYRTFSGVILHLGPILTLPRTQSSLLTVACRVGTTSIGPYWSAHSEDEVERLRGFAKILVKAVSL